MAARKTTAHSLDQLATEINTRLSKADTMEGKAGDHRLAACLQLAEAKKVCREQKIAFAKWARENVHYAFETVRKYAAVGASSDPAKALADMRGQAREGMRKSRGATSIEDNTPEGVERRHRRAQAEIAIDRFDKVPERDLPAVIQHVIRKTPGLVIEGLKEQFHKLRAKDQEAFTYWAAEETGIELAEGESEATG